VDEIASEKPPKSNVPDSAVSAAEYRDSARPSIQPVLKGLPLGMPAILTVDFAFDDPGTLVEDPDSMLSVFQKRLATQVPFVVIPQNMKAERLRREKPFLYMSVMMAASFENTAIQLRLGKNALEQLTERLILRGEKSLDLLQGLLVYLSWFVLLLHYLRSCLELAGINTASR
jgi:hypothetical protein